MISQQMMLLLALSVTDYSVIVLIYWLFFLTSFKISETTPMKSLSLSCFDYLDSLKICLVDMQALAKCQMPFFMTIIAGWWNARKAPLMWVLSQYIHCFIIFFPFVNNCFLFCYILFCKFLPPALVLLLEFSFVSGLS